MRLEPEITPPLSVPYVDAPVEVMAPQPIVPIVAMFLLPSRTTALFAVAVPPTIPSIIVSSVSVIIAEPILKLVPAVTEPDAAMVLPNEEAPTLWKVPDPDTRPSSIIRRRSTFALDPAGVVLKISLAGVSEPTAQVPAASACITAELVS